MAQLEHIEAIEKKLWTAADTLRANSNYASNEYFLPVMGLVFLRHASSRYLNVRDRIEPTLPKRGGKARPLTKEDFSQQSAIFLQPKAQFGPSRLAPRQRRPGQSHYRRDGLHPKTPYRSGELLVRRDTLRRGMLLYMSRGLIDDLYRDSGLAYAATERTGSFLDALTSDYVLALRSRSEWVVGRFASFDDRDLDGFVKEHLGEWGAEFEMDSVLWSEDAL